MSTKTLKLSAVALITALSATTALAAPTMGTASKRRASKARTAKRTPLAATPSLNRQVFTRVVSAANAWKGALKLLARVQGEIVVDPAVQSSITGACSDIVVKVFADGNYTDELSSMAATGNINQGTCQYTMFVKPGSSLRAVAMYEGTRKANHPGDYLEVNGTSGGAFKASYGGTITRNFMLTYDFIK